MDFVTTTELRMFACVCLAVTASCLMLYERCPADITTSNCKFSGARDLAINFVYVLYYLDYLILKFHNARAAPPPPRTSNNFEKLGLSQWPNLGQDGPKNTFNATTTESGMAAGTGFVTSEYESPSLRVMRHGAQQKSARYNGFGIGTSNASSPFASDESMGDMGSGYAPQMVGPHPLVVARVFGNMNLHPKWTQMTSTTPAVSIDDDPPRK